ncbi:MULTISPECIES: hypothetical protein [unclassified Streptomyces]|uniref:hypothetical protein n=1 Tax=unclassified Streptomyces TaxID=2593676 RepID=UPI00363492FE
MRRRPEVRGVVRRLVTDGVTVLLTTQYRGGKPINSPTTYPCSATDASSPRAGRTS